MGFIILPSLQKDWEVTSNGEILQTIVTSARRLASRYMCTLSEQFRSWEALCQADIISVISLMDDCLVIIDSMMNLDLLYYASKHLADSSVVEIVTIHAQSLLKSHLRLDPTAGFSYKLYKYPLYSTCYVVNFDPDTGGVKERRTAQGYRSDSTWARGQAWGVYGYAQTYN